MCKFTVGYFTIERTIQFYPRAKISTMVVVLPAGMSVNIPKYGITHFLRIPFATSRSNPQLLHSLGNVAQDPIAVALPRAAWKFPDELHYFVGVLSLRKPGRLDRAIRLLRELNMDRISETIAATSVTDDLTKPARWSAEMVEPVQAPTISLQGLRPAKERFLRVTKELNCDIKENRPWIEQFKQIVSKIFQDAGLLQVTSLTSRSLSLMLMSTRWLRTDIPNDKPTLKAKHAFLEPSFDASDLVAKYRDFKWIIDFPLERLCISELGVKHIVRNGEVVGTGYHDIASVPLPGSVSSGAPDRKSNDTYIKAAKTIKKSHPVCPLVIPSSPPS